VDVYNCVVTICYISNWQGFGLEPKWSYEFSRVSKMGWAVVNICVCSACLTVVRRHRSTYLRRKRTLRGYKTGSNRILLGSGFRTTHYTRTYHTHSTLTSEYRMRAFGRVFAQNAIFIMQSLGPEMFFNVQITATRSFARPTRRARNVSQYTL